MSKRIKCGAKVRVKSTNEIGVVKGREVVKVDDKRVEVQYVVKLSEGFQNWKAFDKKDIETIKKENVYPKEYMKTYVHENGRVLTLVALVAKLSRNIRVMNMGFAIKHPNDSNNTKLAERIARRRCSSRPICDLTSYGNEFKDDMVTSIMDAKSRYIFNNIDKFVDDVE